MDFRFLHIAKKDSTTIWIANEFYGTAKPFKIVLIYIQMQNSNSTQRKMVRCLKARRNKILYDNNN